MAAGLPEMMALVRVKHAISVLMLVGVASTIAGCGGDEETAAQAPAGSNPPPGSSGNGSALLVWYPPTQNIDGSALTNLAGYKVYWGTSVGNYTNSVTLTNPGLSSYMVERLPPATWYFAVTAVTSTGVESGYSNIGSKVVL
jgi:hypothetical protein